MNGHPLRGPYPDGLETAMFAFGCFWGAERVFWQIDGVYTTAVGYAAGFTPNPTYEEVCSGRTGHTEAVLVVFDPKVVTYDELLRVFWESHDPTQGMRQGNDIGTQYRSGIYWYSEEQHLAAEASRTMFQARLRAAGYGEITTEIVAGARVLLRRGLSPAVPGEEPWWLLRARRHRRVVSGRGRRGLTSGQLAAGLGARPALVDAPHQGARQDEIRSGAVARDRAVVDDRDAEQRLDVHVVGLRLQRVPEEDNAIEPAFGDSRAHLLVAAERSAEKAMDGQVERLGHEPTGRARRVQLVVAKDMTVRQRPVEHLPLAVIMGNEGESLARP